MCLADINKQNKTKQNRCRGSAPVQIEYSNQGGRMHPGPHVGHAPTPQVPAFISALPKRAQEREQSRVSGIGSRSQNTSRD